MRIAIPLYKSLFLITFLLSVTGLSAQTQRYVYEKGMMGSPFVLTFYASSDSLAKCAADSVFSRIQQLNDSLSDYRDGSEINKLSATAGTDRWVDVSDDLYRILEISQQFSVQTKGSFDASLGPVVQIWRRAVRKEYLPEKKDIREALDRTGYKKILFDKENRRIKLVQKGMRLDIGGLGKGYAADRGMEVMRHFGITAALIDAGGKLAISDPPPGKEGWNVAISTGRDSVGTVTLSHVGVATSGPTYRFLKINGTIYSHILDPKTGIGLLYNVRTTVISPNATDADVLATAYSVTGIRKGKKYARKYYKDTLVWLEESRNGHVKEWNTILP
ncbi:thiamine biosynthesis lipoprotein [Dyadobacter jejuensis]|uniref:FAD:protein FMN transferase n=1 Tax=Dyadobacter jejuensis TaxID=1082580 RepID=A0A316AHI8_9BACT|nr:FAD:protein FMN transferase [Dyadobacter jejuensis]PWJ57205.1 thiamine biosynthesis lipoprotein [Dyadobacter jejuensis]